MGTSQDNKKIITMRLKIISNKRFFMLAAASSSGSDLSERIGILCIMST